MERFLASTSQPPASDAARGSAVVRTLDSSVIIGPLWRACRHSALCRLAVRLVRSLSVPSSWVATRLSRTPAAIHYPWTRRIAVRSAWLGPVGRAFAAAPRVWRDSGTRRLLDRSTGPLESWQWVRMIGIGVIVAAVTHAVLSGGDAFRGLGALLPTAVLVGIGAGMMAAPRPVAIAWRQWR